MNLERKALYDGYTQGLSITAGALSGKHIGTVISFRYRLPSSGIAAVVIAELRQISHSSGITTLSCQSHDEDRLATLHEFDLDPEMTIVLMEKIAS